MNEPLELPVWNIPPERNGQVSLEGWLAWIEESRAEFINNGQLEKRRKDPSHCPVDVRFEWSAD